MSKSIRGGLSALLAALLILFFARAATAEPAEAPEPTLHPALSIDLLTAESALLIDADTGDVLYARNARVRMYPASTTKMMTLLLALESGIDLDAEVTIPAAAGNVPEGSSVVPVYPGEVMSFRDLLYGLMLRSGNDAANAVAVLVDGGTDAFVAHMNERAARLGCEGTHFTNVHGYHENDHYTTAQDLALIARAGMQYEVFRAIAAAPEWDMRVTRNGNTEIRNIVSRTSLLIEGDKYYYAPCTGIKTGHTGKAGWCFVGSASRDGVNLISVELNCPEEVDKWYDAARLWEYGFAQYETYTMESLLRLAAPGFDTVPVSSLGGYNHDSAPAPMRLELANVSGGALEVPVNTTLEGRLDSVVADIAGGIQIEWKHGMANDGLGIPITAGEVMGTLTCAAPDGSLVTADLLATRTIEAVPLPGPFTFADVWELFACLAALMIGLVVLIVLAEKKRAKKARKVALKKARRADAVKKSAAAKPKPGRLDAARDYRGKHVRK